MARSTKTGRTLDGIDWDTLWALAASQSRAVARGLENMETRATLRSMARSLDETLGELHRRGLQQTLLGESDFPDGIRPKARWYSEKV